MNSQSIIKMYGIIFIIIILGSAFSIQGNAEIFQNKFEGVSAFQDIQHAHKK